ncbi:MAG: hypothetical protein J0L84_03650 [Verrucomicrobia bacterium]|nr:hypothetical protein [Verrucomicrobiota bacterium]
MDPAPPDRQFRSAALGLLLSSCSMVAAGPDNDSFVHRIAVPEASATIPVYLVDASTEPGEPEHAEPPRVSAASAWWEWTAPGDGSLLITPKAGFPALAVYRGDSLAALQLEARSRVGDGTLPPVRVQEGVRYAIAASQWTDPGAPQPAPHVASFHIQFLPLPENDSFAERTRLDGHQAILRGHTAGASREAGEPETPGAEQSPTVWWEWTPPATGLATMRSVESSGGFLQWFRGGALDALEPMPTVPTGQPFPVKAGEAIQIVATAPGAGHAGPVEAVVTLSTLRIVSPAPGSRFAAGERIELRLESVPAGLDRLRVLPTGMEGPVLEQMALPPLPPGRYRLSIVGVTAGGDLHPSAEIPVTVAAGADTFADAPAVSGHPAVLGADFSTATREPGEPPTAAGGSEDTVWWRYRAPASGWLFLGAGTQPGGSPTALAEVFRGIDPGRLVPAPRDSEVALPSLPEAYRVEAGLDYHIRLTRLSELPRDWASLQMEFRSTAVGDAFGQPVLLTAEPVHQSFPGDFATVESGEPGTAGFGNGTRWFEFLPPEGGVWNVWIEGGWGTEERMSLMLFAGDQLDSLAVIAGPSRSLEIPVLGGARYRLRLEAPNDLTAGSTVTLRALYRRPPPNDRVAQALDLVPEHGVLEGSNDLATDDPQEPWAVGTERSVWYRFTAPAAGGLRVQALPTEGTADRHRVEVLFARGESESSLEVLHRAVFQSDWTAIELEADESILIRVRQSVFGAPGPTGFVLEHVFERRPLNDALAAAEDLGSAMFALARGTNWLATSEPGEQRLSSFTAGRTVWWQWTSPADGLLEVEALLLPFALFRGDSHGTLVRVAPAGTPNPLFPGQRFSVTAGTRYRIAVDQSGAEGQIQPFGPTGIPGFALSLRLSTLDLVGLTNGTVVPSGVPLTLTVTAPQPDRDGDWLSVTYRRILANPGLLRMTNLATATSPPFAAPPLLLPPGVHQIQAVATNRENVVTFSPPVQVRVAPSNDAFADAETLSGRHFTHGITWSGASLEAGEPPITLRQEATIWYRWVAPARGILQLAPPAGLRPGVYTGAQLASLRATPAQAAGAGFHYAVSPDAPCWIRLSAPTSAVGAVFSGTLHGRLTTTTFASPGENELFTAGSPVLLRVETSEAPDTVARVRYLEGETLIATVTAPPWQHVWTGRPPGYHEVQAVLETVAGDQVPVEPRGFRIAPVNDTPASAVPMEGDRGALASNTTGALPDIPGNSSGDVWFDWTASADGLLVATPQGLGGFVEMALFTGTDPSALTLVPKHVGSVFSNLQLGTWEVTAGTRYRLAVMDAGADSGGSAFELVWAFHPPAVNDRFAQRLMLSGTGGDVTASVVLAGLEAAEPGYGNDYPVIASAWWTWTPNQDGVLEISFPDNNAPPTSVRPMTGSSLGHLAVVPAIGNPPPFLPGPRFYAVRSGIPLQLAYVSGFDDRADLRWQWRLLPLPANDRMSGAERLSGPSVSVSGSTLGAGREAGEPFPSDNFFNTVWWRWEAPEDGDLLLRLRNLRTTHAVALYRGTEPAATSLASVGYLHADTTAPMELRVARGETLWILVGSLEAPGQEFAMELALRTRPANDDFSQRMRLNGSAPVADGGNWLSTREFREPHHAGGFGGRSVWYAWRAPADGEAVVSVSDIQTSLLLAAYSGSEVGALREVASAVAGTGGAPLRFAVRSGADYAIAVDGEMAGTTGFRLALEFTPDAVTPGLRLLPRGDSGFRVEGLEGAAGDWILEESPNLSDWMPVLSWTPGASPAVDFPEDAARPVRFFRLRR